MPRNLTRVLSIFLLIYSGTAEARVFDMSEEGFAPYIGGHYLLFSSGIDGDHVSSGGTGNTFDSTYTTGMAYEFGFTYGIQKIRLLFGLQYLKPPTMATIKGSDASGVEQYVLENDISGIIYKAGFEIDLKTWKESRLLLEAQYGSATITVSNTYTFSPGYGGALSNFKEEIKGTAPLIQAGLGWEFVGFDSTTMLMTMGYRQLAVSAFTHNKAITNFQGNTTIGSPANNDDGTARTMTLTGYYVSVLFRFWLK